MTQIEDERPRAEVFQNFVDRAIERGAGASIKAYVNEIPVNAVSIDWTAEPGFIRRNVQTKIAVQGNLDPVALFAPISELRTKVHELLKRTGTRPGHIFNLGHGILPETPVDHVRAVVEMVREFKP